MTPRELMAEANQLPPDKLAMLAKMLASEVAPPANQAEALMMECACRFIAFMTGYRPEVPQ